MKPKITFDEDCGDFILKAFKYVVNKSGVIVNKKTRRYVPALDGKSVYYHEFAGIVAAPEGPRLLRKNIVDLIEAMDRKLI
jgi:hypothetical protein